MCQKTELLRHDIDERMGKLPAATDEAGQSRTFGEGGIYAGGCGRS